MTVEAKIKSLNDQKTSLEERFQEAVRIVDLLKGHREGVINVATQLTFYGYFKQANLGDCTTSKPLYPLVDRYKWDSWNKQKGTSKEEAQKKYIELIIKTLKENQVAIDKIFAEHHEVSEEKEEKKEKAKIS